MADWLLTVAAGWVVLNLAACAGVFCAAEGTGGGCVKRADKQDDNKTRAGQIPVGEAWHTEGPAAIRSTYHDYSQPGERPLVPTNMVSAVPSEKVCGAVWSRGWQLGMANRANVLHPYWWLSGFVWHVWYSNASGLRPGASQLIFT